MKLTKFDQVLKISYRTSGGLIFYKIKDLNFIDLLKHLLFELFIIVTSDQNDFLQRTKTKTKQ